MRGTIETLNDSPWNTSESIDLNSDGNLSSQFSEPKRSSFHRAVRFPILLQPLSSN
jgi:hypothetical protein